MTLAIAMAANYGYIRQLETTIKSVLMHNTNIHFYVMNSDIPQDWFEVLNAKLNPIGSKVVDEKVDPALLSQEHISQAHLNSVAYAKFYVPDRIRDDVVLYLDSDVIVEGSLEPLFKIRFANDELVAAAKEVEDPSSYNDGVIVYNNKQLQLVANLTSTLLEMGHNDQLYNGDQTVFNNYFAGHIKVLPSQYNYEIGMDRWAFRQNRTDMIERLSAIKDPVIIHYANNDKPWNTNSSGRLRSLWWKYYSVDWKEVIQSTQSRQIPLDHINPIKIDGKLFTMTNDQNLEHLEELVQKLPNWQFNIGAYTYVGWNLGRMPQYPNVKIHPCIMKYKIDQLFKESDAYLDTNFGSKEVDLISRYEQTGRPVLTFESSKTAEIEGGIITMYLVMIRWTKWSTISVR